MRADLLTGDAVVDDHVGGNAIVIWEMAVVGVGGIDEVTVAGVKCSRKDPFIELAEADDATKRQATLVLSQASLPRHSILTHRIEES